MKSIGSATSFLNIKADVLSQHKSFFHVLVYSLLLLDFHWSRRRREPKKRRYRCDRVWPPGELWLIQLSWTKPQSKEPGHCRLRASITKPLTTSATCVLCKWVGCVCVWVSGVHEMRDHRTHRFSFRRKINQKCRQERVDFLLSKVPVVVLCVCVWARWWDEIEMILESFCVVSL